MTVRHMTIEELLQRITVQALMCEFQWVYFPAPKLILEQKNGMTFFLRPNSNKWEFLPRN